MKVLLTGANGFLGRYVHRSLVEYGIETVTTGRVRPAANIRSRFIAADLLNERDIQNLIDAAEATHLVHLGWYVEHGKYWNSPLNLRWAESTVRLVESFCIAGGQKVVAAGTCAEYARSDVPCQEGVTLLIPETLYAVAKDATRRLVMAACTHYKVPCAWGRVFFPFGVGENSQRLIPSLIAVARGEREPFGVNKRAYRDFLHASDVAEGFVTLLQPQAAGSYNVCSGEGAQIERIVREIAALSQTDPAAVLALTTERPGEPGFVIGESSKLRALGWRPRLSLIAALEQTLSAA